MIRMSMKLLPLLVIAAVVVVLPVDMGTIPESDAGLAPLPSHTDGDQPGASVQPNACSTKDSQIGGVPVECSFQPVACNHCHTAPADCPDFAPLGCHWACVQHCCELSC